MTPDLVTVRHEPTADCDGVIRPQLNLGHGTRPFGYHECPICLERLCACEAAYGHDCEEEA